MTTNKMNFGSGRKLTGRQKEIILQLISEEIEQLKDDVEDGPESEKYSEDLEDLESIFQESNRIEVFE